MKITDEIKEAIRLSPLTESARLVGLRIGCDPSMVAYYRGQFRKKAGAPTAAKPAKSAAKPDPKPKALIAVAPAPALISVSLSEPQIDAWWARLSLKSKGEVLASAFSNAVIGLVRDGAK